RHQRQRASRAAGHRLLELAGELGAGALLEDHHPVVLADGEDLGGPAHAHRVGLAEIAIDDDCHGHVANLPPRREGWTANVKHVLVPSWKPRPTRGSRLPTCWSTPIGAASAR